MRSIKQIMHSRKRNLAVFAVAFALIGGLLVFKSFAATSYTMKLSASSTSVAKGGSFTLSWSIKNYGQESGMLCTLTDSNKSYSSFSHFRSPGSQIISNFQKTDTFYMHCEDHCSGGVCNDVSNGSITVTAIAAPAPAPQITLTANPGYISYRSSSTLSWRSTNTTSCIASGAWSGRKALSGSASTGQLTYSRTYTLSCSGSGGSKSLSIKVTVGPAPSTSGSNTRTITVVPAPATNNTNAISISFISDVTVSNITDTSAQVSWTTSKAVVGNLSYGLSPDNLDNSVNEQDSNTRHDLSIINLAPSTTYYFLIDVKDGSKEYKQDGVFTTADSSSNNVSASQGTSNTPKKKAGGSVGLVIFLFLLLLLIAGGIILWLKRRQSEDEYSEDTAEHQEAEEFFRNASQEFDSPSQLAPTQTALQGLPAEPLFSPPASTAQNTTVSDTVPDMFSEGRERLQREGLTQSAQPPQAPETKAPTTLPKQTQQEAPKPKPLQHQAPEHSENTSLELKIDHGS